MGTRRFFPSHFHDAETDEFTQLSESMRPSDKLAHVLVHSVSDWNAMRAVVVARLRFVLIFLIGIYHPKKVIIKNTLLFWRSSSKMKNKKND